MNLLRVAARVAALPPPQHPDPSWGQDKLRVLVELPAPDGGEEWLAGASYEEIAKLVLDATQRGAASLDAEIVKERQAAEGRR